MMITNPKQKKSEIIIELYTFAIPTRERIRFVVKKTDKNIYDFFIGQYNYIHEHSRLIENHDYV